MSPPPEGVGVIPPPAPTPAFPLPISGEFSPGAFSLGPMDGEPGPGIDAPLVGRVMLRMLRASALEGPMLFALLIPAPAPIIPGPGAIFAS